MRLLPAVLETVLADAPARRRAAARAGLCGVLALAPAALAQDVAPPAEASGTAGETTDALRRLVRRFDFEESETELLTFPKSFHRIVAIDRGFPEFGQLEPTRDASFSGNWSFGFSLDGGSLSAAIPTGVLPVLPLADYMVTARVRTQGLRHARARVVTWLHDATGRPIPHTRVESRPVRTFGEWDTVRLHVSGNDEAAADLVIELQLLQPAQLRQGPADPRRPEHLDVTGHVWFDDVSVWHVPRIQLAVQSADNVIARPDLPTLSMLVSDLAQDALTARLTVRDLTGQPVFEDEFPAPRGPRPLTRRLPMDRCGWYRAELEVRSGAALAGRGNLEFVIVPGPPPRGASRTNPLEVVLPFEPARRLDAVPRLVQHLGVGGAVVEVWSGAMRAGEGPGHLDALRRMVETMLVRETELTFALEGVPVDLARASGVDSDQVLELLTGNPQLWRPRLDELLVNFGLRVPRWQLGSARRPDAFWKPGLPALVDGATAALGRFLSDPVIIVPFDATQQVPDELPTPALHIRVPYAVDPEMLADYAAPWTNSARDVVAVLEPLPEDVYTPSQRVLDLALRTLAAWRAGLPRIAAMAPWEWSDRDTVRPSPIYALWRGLGRALRDRRFDGEVFLHDDVRCWLMRRTGSAGADGALVAWRERSGDGRPAMLRVRLADGPVRVRDAFGNEHVLPLEDGTHEISVGAYPIFVEGVDLPLAHFRSGLSIEPGFISADQQVHDGALVIHNPWPVAISGTIRLREQSDLEISPRRIDFAIPPDDSTRVPLTIVHDRSIAAGPKRIDADVRLIADREHRLDVSTDLEVGWQDIELRASWSFARNARTGLREVIVSQIVTNRGDEPVSLDVFLVAPGVRQNRRAIASLMPGATATRTFHLPGEVDALGGRMVRLGVSERGGLAQLNQLMVVPRLIASEPEG